MAVQLDEKMSELICDQYDRQRFAELDFRILESKNESDPIREPFLLTAEAGSLIIGISIIDEIIDDDPINSADVSVKFLLTPDLQILTTVQMF